MTGPAPLVLETTGLEDYALLDSGGGRKLERFGALRLDRPEEQAIWTPRLPAAEWERADARFTGDTDEEGAGRWKRRPELDESWVCRHGAIRFSCRFTSFRHVGAFPEQEAHWTFMRERLAAAGERPALLNLFGYTGLASLIAAHAGAEVTHVDASKKAIAWARDNQELSGLGDRPIRWILDDAGKFAARDVRRARRYDGILLDPPKFGRGPHGETWDLFTDLPAMLRLCRDLLKPSGFLILTAYAIRASFLSLERLSGEVLGPSVQAGELALRDQGGDLLATSLFCRWAGR
jgi:23S rRNA (cytosine1962-C5)-methyltransferase